MSGRVTWTPEQADAVRRLAGGRTPAAILRRVNALGPTHTPDALSDWARRQGIGLRMIPRPHRGREIVPWSEEEDAFLREHLGRRSLEAIHAALNARFRTNRTVGAVRRRACALGESLLRFDGVGMQRLAALLAMRPHRIRREVAAGRLHAAQRGNGNRGSYWLFRPADVEAWVRANPHLFDWRRMAPGAWRDLARAAGLRDPHLSVTDTARHLGIDRKLVQRWIRLGLVRDIRNVGTGRKPIYRVPLRMLDQIEALARRGAA